MPKALLPGAKNNLLQSEYVSEGSSIMILNTSQFSLFDGKGRPGSGNADRYHRLQRFFAYR